MKIKTLNWDVCTEAVITSTQATNKMAIKRTDNNKILAVVGEKYHPVSNAKLHRFVNRLCEHEFSFEGYSVFKEGKVILAFLKNRRPGLHLNDFPIDEYLVIGNSHDGTKKFYIGTSSRLIRCMNQFTSTVKIFGKKHTSPLVLDEISVEDLVNQYLESKTELYDSFSGWDKIKVSDHVVENLIRQVHLRIAVDSKLDYDLIGRSPSMHVLRNSIGKEMEALGENAFGLFNGVTYYTTHEMRQGEENFGRIDNTGDNINQLAYRFCLDLKLTQQ